MGFEKLQSCPVCQGTRFHDFISCRDHTATQETFTIVQCKSCSFLATSPRPDDQSLPYYYKSENYISHTGGRGSIADRLYTLVRRFALKWKLDLVKESKSAGDILDFGCGTGEFLEICRGNGWSIAGVEPSDTARKKASSLTRVPIHEKLEDVKDPSFDVITLWHVLEHITDLNKTLSNLADRLRQGGTIFIAVPNFESHDGQYYKNFWAGYDVPRHVWHFTPTTMSLLLSQHGLNVKEIIPMKQDAYYVSLLSEKYKHPDHGILRSGSSALLRGFRSNLHARKNKNYSSLVYRIQP